jgi:hypothetical protein
VAFLCHDLRAGTRCSAELRPFAELELDAVHRRAQWNLGERQRIPQPNLGVSASADLGTPALSRRKSIWRYRRLCPPPRCLAVRWPR